MCGIAGYWSRNAAPDAAIAGQMARMIEHRGPDDAGIWLDTSSGLALAHRRLSIIDISAAGHQPMVSPCGNYVLCFNGEIYNHTDLRQELQREGGQFDWCGHSDTETLLAALRHWGVESALRRLNGMFAFAFWDKSRQILFLARDRMGEKPLFYGSSGNTFLFGSELKSLVVHPDWRGNVARGALALYLRHNYVPAPHSIYEGIGKLPPAHYVAITGQGTEVTSPRCYWNLRRIAEDGIASRAKSTDDFIHELDSLVRDAVGRRMVADVPLGAFLSGGFDSTLIVAQMQAQASRPVQTFSIGFHEETHNEARYAKAVAAHLGTDHTELYVSSDQALNVIPKLPKIWDEPFADSSQIPTFLVSQLASDHVTVSLSGDGGDELFFGYKRYALGLRVWRWLRMLPGPLRKAAVNFLQGLPDRVMEPAINFISRRLGQRNLPYLLPKLAELAKHSSSEDFYEHLVSHWKNPGALVLGGSEPKTRFGRYHGMPKLPGLAEQMMYLDSVTYLPDDILTKVDRASMAVSLEARVPLLDHRLVEFAWRVPQQLKFRDGEAKWLLRQVLYRYVPRNLMDRPKMGFGVPIEHWLRGPLREWAHELLDERRLKDDGYFDPEPVRELWKQHLDGTANWHYYLWDILMFQSWLEYTQTAGLQRDPAPRAAIV